MNGSRVIPLLLAAVQGCPTATPEQANLLVRCVSGPKEESDNERTMNLGITYIGDRIVDCSWADLDGDGDVDLKDVWKGMGQ